MQGIVMKKLDVCTVSCKSKPYGTKGKPGSIRDVKLGSQCIFFLNEEYTLSKVFPTCPLF